MKNKIVNMLIGIGLACLLLISIRVVILKNNELMQYKTLIQKYQKQINKLIAENELSNNKITKLTVDMQKRQVIITSLKTKIKNGKVDSIFLFNHYELSPYGNITYDVTIKDTIGHYIITPKTKVSDVSFLFHPNISILYNGDIFPAFFVSVFHYKRAGAEFGVSYEKQFYINGGINYFIWSNLLLKVGVMANFNLQHYFYVGVGCNF